MRRKNESIINKNLDEQSIIEEALRIRRFEEKLLGLFSKGLIRGTIHTCLGQELIPVTLTQLLTEDDFVFGTHRGHGYFLAQTGDYRALAREILGKQGGLTGGIGGTQHLLAPRLLTNGIQGGLVPVAAGYASSLAEGQIAVSVVGDGSLGQGTVYESLNLAAVFAVPLLLLIEDNGMAQSTRSSEVFAGDLKTRIDGFGVKYFECSDESVPALVEVMKEAVEYVRVSGLPGAIRVTTRRLGPHSKGDDNRSEDELAQLRSLDPLANWLSSSPVAVETDQEITQFLEGVFEEAINSESATAVPENRLRGQNMSLKRREKVSTSEKLIREQISQSIEEAMEGFVGLKMLGEDIEVRPLSMEKPYNGAFGVTGRISPAHHHRLSNTPISEQAIVGFGIGRALANSETIVEVMFGDFTTLTIDQVRQQASKISSIYGSSINLPFLIRTPMGGRRGYGPTHSQSLEGLFFGIPNLVLYSVSPFGIEKSLFSDLLSTGLPTVVFESKELYPARQLDSMPVPYVLTRPEDMSAPLVLEQRVRRAMFTVVTYGSAAKWCLEALGDLAREHEVLGRLFICELLQPMNLSSVHESVIETENLLLVEESQPQEGLTNSLLYSLQEFSDYPQFRFGSIGCDGDIGASQAAEDHALISAKKIVRKVLDLLEA